MIEIEGEYLAILIILFMQFLLILWIKAIHDSELLSSSTTERNVYYGFAIFISIFIWFMYALITKIIVII